MLVTVCEMNDDRELFANDWKRLADHVKRNSSDVVLLPEMPFYHWIYTKPKFDAEVWEESVSAHREWLGRLDELGADTVLGSAPVEVGNRRLNQGFQWSQEDGIKGVHYKSYLPNEPGYYEASWYDKGDRAFVPFEVAGAGTGMMICTDLWSMKHARGYGKEGVHMIISPRATGKATVDKWVAGGKVAAVVSGSYCFSSNRSGKRGETEFGGHGWAIDPDGRLLGFTSKKRPFVTVKMNPKVAERAKATYPRDSLEPD